MSKLQKIYDVLLEEFGPQGWWPVTKEGKLVPRYDSGPKNGKQQFEVVVGAILTQNTSWANVEKAIFNLNKAKLIDAEKLLETDEKKLASLIKPAGYYNQKAKKLKNVAVFFAANKDIFKLKVPLMREKLLAVNGIGPETADSIILYAANKPIFLIDAYTKRIMFRLGFCKEDVKYDELQKLFMNNLPKDAKIFNEYHALLVEHAKIYCRKKPNCIDCILRRNCNYLNNKNL